MPIMYLISSAPEKRRCGCVLLKRLTKVLNDWHDIYQNMEKRNLLLPNYGEIKSFLLPERWFFKSLEGWLNWITCMMSTCCVLQAAFLSNTEATATKFKPNHL
jgi:hypothetical protein